MSIKPTPADIGRRVKLPIFNGPDMTGSLVEVMSDDQPFARVAYDGQRFPVATDIEKLEWAD